MSNKKIDDAFGEIPAPHRLLYYPKKEPEAESSAKPKLPPVIISDDALRARIRFRTMIAALLMVAGVFWFLPTLLSLAQ